MRKSRASRGASLFEVVVATLFVSTSVLAGAASVLESTEHQRANARLRAAAPVMASLLDEVRSVPFDELDASYSGWSENVIVPDTVNDATATYEVEDVPTGSSRWLVRRVTVRLRWVSAAGVVDITGSTLVSDRTVDRTAGATVEEATVTPSSVPTTTTGASSTGTTDTGTTDTGTTDTGTSSTGTSSTSTSSTGTSSTGTSTTATTSSSPGIGVGSTTTGSGKSKGRYK